MRVFLIIMMVVLSGCATGTLQERMSGIPDDCKKLVHTYCHSGEEWCGQTGDREYVDEWDSHIMNYVEEVKQRVCILEHQ